MNIAREGWVYPLLIFIGCFVIYGQVYDHHFVWDTIPFVLENPLLHDPGIEEIVAMFTSAHVANWQPMVMLSHALDFSLFGMNAGAHHLVNVLFHAINSCLVYLVLTTILRIGGAFDPDRRRLVAFIAALIFAIHPQHVESVAWVVERKDMLYTLFALLSVYFYLRRHEESAPNHWGKALPVVFFVMSLLSKPMAVTLPVVLLLLDVYPLARCERLKMMPRLILEKWLWWLLALGVGLITLQTQTVAMLDAERLPLWMRPLTAVNNVLFYLYCYVVPVGLSPFYPFPDSIDAVKAVSYWLPGGLFIVITTLAAAVLWRRGIRWPALMWVFYLATLAPVSGVIHVGPAKATDHYTYLATLPAGLLFSLAIVRLLDVRVTRTLSMAVAVVAVLVLGTVSWYQVKIWHNPVSLWTYTLGIYPDSALAHRNMASALVRIGEYERALEHAAR
ncbi:MAG: hypothetical protein HUJ31_11070, partial [Pseudomonadales bacterium]|nr:hypothetical protein [Pseudomonadales bacterium]